MWTRNSKAVLVRLSAYFTSNNAGQFLIKLDIRGLQ
jgi:hypothetical protein